MKSFLTGVPWVEFIRLLHCEFGQSDYLERLVACCTGKLVLHNFLSFAFCGLEHLTIVFYVPLPQYIFLMQLHPVKWYIMLLKPSPYYLVRTANIQPCEVNDFVNLYTA